MCILPTISPMSCCGPQGFRKVDPDRWEFANEGFLRGQRHLLKTITRRKPAHGHGHQHQQQAHAQNSSVGACVELGKFGLEEEVEQLKRDKNVLMQELVRLRQQQQATDNQLQAMVQRLHGMEQRQQQMMSFLAKAVQSPSFFAQFVQQQTESNRRINDANKKRRLKQEGVSELDNSSSPDGQIVKYQPLMNGSTKAMLRQLRKLDSSSSGSPDTSMIDDSFSTSAIHSKSPPDWVSGVTLQEVPPTSRPAYMTATAEMKSEIQSSPAIVNSETVTTAEFPEISGLVRTEAAPSVAIPETDTIIPELLPIPDIIGNNPDISRENYMVPDNGEEFMDLTSLDLNGTMPLEIDKLSPDDIDALLDASWEQYFDHSVICDENDEYNLPLVENPSVAKEGQRTENGWDKSEHMDQLTEQMGLLNSDAKIL